jgi:hypothetical protein
VSDEQPESPSDAASTPPAASPAPVVDPANWVPRNKYAELKRKYDAMESQVASFDSERQSWAQERGLMSLGLLDAEARDVARLLHSRLPEDGRPPLVDWAATVMDGRTDMPRALQAYIRPASTPSTPSTPSAATPPPAPAATPAPPADSRAQLASSPTGSTVSRDALRAAKEHGVRTGDWQQFNDLANLAKQAASR